MSRLIDADALIEEVAKITDLRTLSTKTIGEAIDRVPTIEERKTGFWYALEKGDRGYSAGDFKCSVCGEPNRCYIPKPNYCPHCGARMTEGKT